MKAKISLFFIIIFTITTNSKAQTSNLLSINDTRSINALPNFSSSSIIADFKTRSVIGVPGDGLYSTNLTISQWGNTDNTGDKNHQLNFNNGGIFYRSAFPLDPQWGSWRKIILTDENGNVGIGINNPTKKLDIYSNTNTTLKIANGDPATYPTEIHLGGYPDFTKSAIISAPNAAGWYRQDLFFCLANGNDLSSVGLSDAAMVIKSYNSGKFGNVGIGTINPDEKLTVKGKIHTQEVRVDLLGPLVPDYVFSNDYKLKSLEEVEDYIKQNSHLPEIPSAKEIEKNGLMLAEMNMSLLKKIEELTLYSIEQNKKIEAQSKEIETLKDLVLRVSKIENDLAKK